MSILLFLSYGEWQLVVKPQHIRSRKALEAARELCGFSDEPFKVTELMSDHWFSRHDDLRHDL